MPRSNNPVAACPPDQSITPLLTGELFYLEIYYGIRSIVCKAFRIPARKIIMGKTPATSIFLGLFLGAVLGSGIGMLGGNVIHGLQLGALTGVFLGWILTSPALQE